MATPPPLPRGVHPRQKSNLCGSKDLGNRTNFIGNQTTSLGADGLGADGLGADGLGIDVSGIDGLGTDGLGTTRFRN